MHESVFTCNKQGSSLGGPIYTLPGLYKALMIEVSKLMKSAQYYCFCIPVCLARELLPFEGIYILELVRLHVHVSICRLAVASFIALGIAIIKIIKFLQCTLLHTVSCTTWPTQWPYLARQI